MRPSQIFAEMSPMKCEQVVGAIAGESPETIRQTVATVAMALKFRPQYLQKQPIAKRVSALKRVLSRASSDPLAEELLAIYFLKCRLPLLTEWLDLMGLAHEDGMLTGDETPCPDAPDLAAKVSKFRAVDDDDDRELLMRVFSAQTAIDWPALDEILAAR